MKSKDYYNDAYKRIMYRRKKMKFPTMRDDENFTDDQFFRVAVEYEILNNAISAVVNILTDSIESQSVDNYCRSILEGLAVMNLADEPNTYLNDDRKYIFRRAYSPIELTNEAPMFSQIIDIVNNQRDDPKIINQLSNSLIRYDEHLTEFKECACKIFNCDIDKLTINIIACPDLYLRKKLNENSPYKRIIRQYDTKDKKHEKMYQFFSTMIHPWSETDISIKRQILDYRENYIDDIISMVLDYIEPTILDYTDESVEDYQSVIYDPKISRILESLTINFQYQFKYVKLLVKSVIHQSIPLFDSLGLIMKDQYAWLTINVNASSLVKFKSYVEIYVAIVYFLSKDLSKDDRQYKMQGFILSSRLREIDCNASNLKKSYPTLYKELESIYLEYYSKNLKYANLKDIDEFINKMKSSWYYSLISKPVSMSRLVREILNQFLGDDIGVNDKNKLADEVYEAYKLSLDMEHASGYSNLSSSFLVLYSSVYMLRLSTKLLQSFEKVSPTLLENKDLDKFAESIYSICDELDSYILEQGDKVREFQ